MPRLPRVNYPNAVYHVTARGNGRATIFFEDADRHRFLRQLCDSLETESVFPMDAMRESRYAIGGEAFVEETQKRLEQQRTGSLRDEDIALPTVTVDIQTVDTYVARHYRIGARRSESARQTGWRGQVRGGRAGLPPDGPERSRGGRALRRDQFRRGEHDPPQTSRGEIRPRVGRQPFGDRHRESRNRATLNI